MTIDREQAAALLEALVSIPSLSGDEERASTWLVERMDALGYDRAFVDEGGSAVGEIGDPEAARTLVLLGHIDTVAGDVPVHRRTIGDDEVLYGRGSVDAKGPLAAFVAAAANGAATIRAHPDLRVIVVGATEEESASSRGARAVRDRLQGDDAPDACIIGEPSQWQRVTLGYKGRLLVDLEARRAMTHTAGPDPGVAVEAVELWNFLRAFADAHNRDLDSPFAQLLPSLRWLGSGGDGLHETASAHCGLRLPLDFDVASLTADLEAWLSTRLGEGVEIAARGSIEDRGGERQRVLRAGEEDRRLELTLSAYEPAWLSRRDSDLVRAFQYAIRDVGGGETRPGFVTKTGTSDMNVVAPVWNCPIVAYGPGDSALDHTPDEHLSLDELWQSVRVLQTALGRWAELTRPVD